MLPVVSNHTLKNHSTVLIPKAAVLCPPVVKDTLVNYARNFIFTTAPAFLTMATVKASYNVIASEEGAKVRLCFPGIVDRAKHFLEERESSRASAPILSFAHPP